MAMAKASTVSLANTQRPTATDDIKPTVHRSVPHTANNTNSFLNSIEAIKEDIIKIKLIIKMKIINNIMQNSFAFLTTTPSFKKACPHALASKTD